jgi:sigma-B regulation protein RsbU (phosphoserine phosphatase)
VPSPKATPAAEAELLRLRRAVEELSILNDLASRLSATFELDDVMRMVMERSRQAVNAEQAKISLIDADDTSHFSTVVHSRGRGGDDDYFRLHDGLMGCVLAHRGPLLFDDPAGDERLRGVELQPGIRNLACVPLDVGGRMIGVLTAFNKRDGKSFDQDDQRLLSIIASQSAQVLERARLLEQERAARRMAEELQLARRIQASLLPAEAPAIPGYIIHGFSEPAQEVGGDYYDFLELGDDRWGVALGDVSGKGVPAAMLMANLQATLRGQAPRSASCSECVEWCNRLVCRSTTPDKFATLFYALLDPRHHRLRFCNAGHERPVLLRDGEGPTLLDPGNLVVGILENAVYHDAVLDLEPGDRIVIYSDGVTDMLDPNGQLFDLERLLVTLQAHRDLPADALADALAAAVHEHAATAPVADDMTLVVIQRRSD